MRDLMTVTKALADENRVRMLLALRDGELCVCQIVALMRLATSTVSKHMSILKQAGLVESRKEGRWMYYRLAGPEGSKTVRQAIEWGGGRPLFLGLPANRYLAELPSLLLPMQNPAPPHRVRGSIHTPRWTYATAATNSR